VGKKQMEMKRTSLTISLVFYCILVAAQNDTSMRPGNTLSLRQCIETGLKNNLDVLQSQLTMESDKINMNQAKLNLLPDLNGSASHSFSQGRSIDPYSNTPVTQNVSASNFSLSSGVILFNGLALQNAIKQNSLLYQASKMDWQQVKDNLTINIILAYLQVLSSGDQLSQARNQAALSGEQVKRLEILDQRGAIRPSDLSDLRGQYASDQVDIINMQNALETAKISLCSLMNVPYDPSMTLESIEAEAYIVRYESTREQIYQNALKELALVKAADFREQSAEKAVKVARGYLYPTLSFGASISTNYSSVAQQNEFVSTTYEPTTDTAVGNNIKLPVYRFQDNFTPYAKIPYMDQINNNVFTSYGFTLRVPIFNALVQRNRVKQAKLNLQNQHYVASTTRTELGRRVDQAYVNMLSAYDRYKITLDQVTAFTESFRAAEIRFNSGVGTSVDYLVVKNSLDRANLALITAKYDYVLRTKVLDFYQGKQLW
jgi:outer membrane protein